MQLTGFDKINKSLSDRIKGKAQMLIDILRASDKPIYAVSLAKYIGESEVDTRQLIRWLRLQLKEIASDDDGFAWAWWREDLLPTASHLYQREVSIHIVRVCVEQRAAQLPSKCTTTAIQVAMAI